MPQTPHNIRRTRRGFSLLETLVLVVVLGVVGAAAGTSLIAVAKSPAQNNTQLQLETYAVSKMEAIRAMPFDSIATGDPSGALSGYVTLDGKTYTCNVTVSLTDANGDGAPDATLKRIDVALGGRTLSMLVSR